MPKKRLHQKTIYIEHTGCSRRGLDTRRFFNYFIANGCKIVKRPYQADIIFFITCSYRAYEEDYAVKRIEQLKKNKGQLIVSGCFPGTNPKRLLSIFNGISFSRIDNNRVDEIFPSFKIPFSSIPSASFPYPKSKRYIWYQLAPEMRPIFNFYHLIKEYIFRRISKKNYCIEIGRGCSAPHCTYCKIWRASGDLRSKTLEKCKEELVNAVKKGFRNIILIADNPGAYGIDIGETLPRLLDCLCANKGQFKLEIQSLHPYWLLLYKKELLRIFGTGKIASAVFPIQSGSQKIVNAMNRHYPLGQVADMVRYCKNNFPNMYIGTYIIIGFPTETEADFQATLTLLKNTPFDSVHFFAYGHNEYITDKQLLMNQISFNAINDRMLSALGFCKKNNINAIGCAKKHLLYGKAL